MCPAACGSGANASCNVTGGCGGHLQSADILSHSVITGQTGKGQGEHDLANNT